MSPGFSIPRMIRASVGLCLGVIIGCTNAVESGHGTALTGLDLKSMTNEMASSIAASPRVREAVATMGELRVVVEPAQNEMEAEILPQGQAEAFTSRVRFLLSQHNAGQYVWIMNRDEFYDLRGKERDDVLGPSPDAINPDYALTAHFRSLTHETSTLRSSAYLCVYELTNLKDRTLLWTEKYEVQKRAGKGFLD